MTKLIAVMAATAAMTAAAPALGANPPGTGQPNQSCEDLQATGPPGITSTTNGFATQAVNVYAGSDGTPSLANGDSHAVSQYDVACFQVSSR
jgi:hypothetical protein